MHGYVSAMLLSFAISLAAFILIIFIIKKQAVAIEENLK
jgi:hypothetical protein